MRKIVSGHNVMNHLVQTACYGPVKFTCYIRRKSLLAGGTSKRNNFRDIDLIQMPFYSLHVNLKKVVLLQCKWSRSLFPNPDT